MTPYPKVTALMPLIKAICQDKGFPSPSIIAGQVHIESAGNPLALTMDLSQNPPVPFPIGSENSGRGLMQPEPFYYWKALGFSNVNDCDLAFQSPGYNLETSVAIMKQNLGQYNDIVQALEAYNTGNPNPGNTKYATDCINASLLYP